MRPDLSRLIQRMSPGLVVRRDIDWDAVVNQWGRQFPADYMEFANIYDAGTISNYLLVGSVGLIPEASTTADFTYLTPTADQLEMLESPFPAFPDPGGLIGWAANPDGDSVFWETGSEEWKIVVWRRHPLYGASHWSIYDCGMVEFLLRIFDCTLPENPFSGTDLWGISSPKFLHWAEEQKLRETGLDPWV